MAYQSVLYAGIFLDGPSRQQLLALAPPTHSIVKAEHLTLIFKPSSADLRSLPWGLVAELQVSAETTDAAIQAWT